MQVHFSSTFKKQYKKYLWDKKFDDRRKELSQELFTGNLHPKWKNHNLSGKFQWMQELHIFPNLVLIYRIEEDIYHLIQIGSHSDLFG